MDTMISLEFIYKSKTYYALVRTKINSQEKQHHITVMNGDLERLLYGHHIITEDDGELRTEEIPDTQIAELRQCIVKAFSQQLV